MSISSSKKNSGHSLVETMIYMILGMIVIGYALSTMTHISKGFVKSRTVMKMQKDGRDAVQVMAREIANTGFKYYIFDTTCSVQPSGDDVDFYVTRPTRTPVTLDLGEGTSVELSNDKHWLYASYTGEYSHLDSDPATMNVAREALIAPDSSASFYFWSGASDGTSHDMIEIYKASLNPNGSGLRDVQRIMYYLNGTDLMRRVQTADDGLLNASYPTAIDAGEAIWEDNTDISTMVLIDNVRALQFQFSENGRDWVDDPNGKRHLMKQIRIQLLVLSSKEFSEKYDIKYKLGDLDPIESGTDGNLYRLYEKIVEIPNNGILLQ